MSSKPCLVCRDYPECKVADYGRHTCGWVKKLEDENLRQNDNIANAIEILRSHCWEECGDRAQIEKAIMALKRFRGEE